MGHKLAMFALAGAVIVVGAAFNTWLRFYVFTRGKRWERPREGEDDHNP
jgi:hypothetical protein